MRTALTLSFQVERSQLEAQETCMAMVCTYKRQRSFEVERKTGSVLCRIAPWGCYRNAITPHRQLVSFFYLEVAWETLTQL